MFDFEKLDVYKVVRVLNTNVFLYLNKNKTIDKYIVDQWKRASLSSLLNLSEGIGRMSKNDKKHFITIARGSIFESVAIIQTLSDLGCVNEEEYNEFYAMYEQASKMLLGLYRSIE